MKLYRNIIIGSIIAIVVILGLVVNSNSFKRGLKSVKSNYSDGLDRVVTVYDYNGNKIKEWSGRFDVNSSETEVYFDIDNKRVIIHGGIVINEEY